MCAWRQDTKLKITRQISPSLRHVSRNLHSKQLYTLETAFGVEESTQVEQLAIACHKFLYVLRRCSCC